MKETLVYSEFAGSRLLPFADFSLCERISFSMRGKRRTSVVGQQLMNCLTLEYHTNTGGNCCISKFSYWFLRLKNNHKSKPQNE